jgi:ubiquinone/menaquinone biosynthesis C-methylase UbiE
MHVGGGTRILDVAAGYCEFINNIAADEKFALDMNPDAQRFAAEGVTVITGSASDVSVFFPGENFDCVFISNFLEHMNSKEEVQHCIQNVVKILKPKGRILILQPNIKYVGGAYWDFFDHKVPLTSDALIELADLLGLKTIECIPKFLPYTTKSSLPQAPWLIWLFIKFMPFSGFFLGKQSFLVFEKD